MNKEEMRARLAEVLAELDRTKERLRRSGVGKAAIPLILGASMGGCTGTATAIYGASCDGDCGYTNSGGSGGTISNTGGEGGAGGEAEGGAGGVGGDQDGDGGAGGGLGGAGGSGGFGGAGGGGGG